MCKVRKEISVVKLTVGSKTFTLNGELLTLDSPPIIKNGRTMISLRFVAENLGAQVGWDNSKKMVTIIY